MNQIIKRISFDIFIDGGDGLTYIILQQFLLAVCKIVNSGLILLTHFQICVDELNNTNLCKRLY